MEKFCVEIPDKDVSELIQKKAFEAGFEWSSADKEIKSWKIRFLYFGCWNPNGITWSSALSVGNTPPKYTIDQALQYFRELKAENEKPKFKAGDWVVPKNGADIKAEQIIEINSGFGHTSFVYAPGCQYTPDYVRHATPAEIEEAQKIKSWRRLLQIMELFDLKKIQHLDGATATFEDIKKIVERLK
ncbi:MAG: hypothetical protein UR73_C0037G0004 [candidate division WS6 bacterium GW2011_GWF1_35_23]|uniref:Uncharacterized protein n=1 Tax=candidate division WS6 bacterium GW2011_GWF1_35_23 TaxID=1619097 RepID=A0A0G0EHN2_9BACT|nr:MAG: hypothetical protein UR73_C0037G0004 [candidate division WS6 bacterium GW2011_GWF1_35_23]